MYPEPKPPVKGFTICYIDNGQIKPFETYQFGEPNNWFNTEADAEEWICEQFIDCPNGETNRYALVVLPVFVITFKPIS